MDMYKKHNLIPRVRVFISCEWDKREKRRKLAMGTLDPLGRPLENDEVRPDYHSCSFTLYDCSPHGARDKLRELLHKFGDDPDIVAMPDYPDADDPQAAAFRGAQMAVHAIPEPSTHPSTYAATVARGVVKQNAITADNATYEMWKAIPPAGMDGDNSYREQVRQWFLAREAADTSIGARYRTKYPPIGRMFDYGPPYGLVEVRQWQPGQPKPLGLYHWAYAEIAKEPLAVYFDVRKMDGPINGPKWAAYLHAKQAAAAAVAPVQNTNDTEQTPNQPIPADMNNTSGDVDPLQALGDT